MRKRTSPPDKKRNESEGFSARGMVEAVLFATGKPMNPGQIAELIREDVSLVKKALKELVEHYEKNPEGALEIGIVDGYILQVKPIYARATETLIPMELGQGALRTLSAIALKQPVLQSDLVEMVGRNAYDHVKDLIEKDLILKEAEGRSYILKTSARFDQYFQVDKNILKRSLQRLEGGEKIEGVESDRL